MFQNVTFLFSGFDNICGAFSRNGSNVAKHEMVVKLT